MNSFSNIKTIWTVCILLPVIMLAFIGCESEVNEDFEGFGSTHPFNDTEDHGSYLSEQEFNFTLCSSCHGNDLQGNGEEDKNCFACHNSTEHPGSFSGIASSEHQGFLRSEDWDIGQCQNCHGNDFGGTIFGSACNTCHTNDGGPSACNTCHGDFSSTTSDAIAWAPPSDLNGNDATSFVTVGAHQAHLDTQHNLTSDILCSACHLVPDTWDQDGHIDLQPADITFGGLSVTGDVVPEWDRNNATCSSTYCHRSSEPVWTEVDGTWSSCSTCHEGELDETIHTTHNYSAFTECSGCHGGIVDSDGVIIDTERHIDGQLNFQ
jgi:predicted CxxxxCH...CXXCH cytochrome family protein